MWCPAGAHYRVAAGPGPASLGARTDGRVPGVE
jgi:hypothetical protein